MKQAADPVAPVVFSTRIQNIQSSMASRALELLALPEGEPAFLLDIGCGSGLSGEILTDEGYEWVGVDVAPSMLEVALEREVEGDLFLQDIGQGFGFRPGSFDGAISYGHSLSARSAGSLLTTLVYPSQRLGPPVAL
jgi:SAM-dependent methyltransferase